MSEDLDQMLGNGWEIAGYSTDMFVAGGTAHNILLRKGNNVSVFSIGMNANGEMGRRVDVLAPRSAPQAKKGFWG